MLIAPHILYLILFWVVGSLIVALLGINRKFGFWGYFFFSLIFTPILGILLVLASDPRKRSARLRADH
jgi:hypothetical protein